MKNLTCILVLAVIYTNPMFDDATHQTNSVPSDSSKVVSTQTTQSVVSNGGVIQNLNISGQRKNPKIDCKESLPDSLAPEMPIFVPDTTLTASMPIFKPGLVDPGIFIPGGECFEPDPNN